MARQTVSDRIWTTLAGLGVTAVFGLPGTQTVPLFESLRRSSLKTIVSSHELAASFMAGGYFRSSGRVAAICTIPGPGFTYALTGLAEARADSAALIHVTVKVSNRPGRSFELQRIDQAAMASPVVKAVFDIDSAEQVTSRVAEAYWTAISGEPGPVLIQISADLLNEESGGEGSLQTENTAEEIDKSDIVSLRDRLNDCSKPMLIIGHGAARAHEAIWRLVDSLECLVVATSSGRGIVPESHPRVLAGDYALAGVAIVNEAIARSDLVVALGCKFSHNATAGFQLQIDQAKLVHVDASDEVLNANYPAALAIRSDVRPLLESVLSGAGSRHKIGWTAEEIESYRSRLDGAIAESMQIAPKLPREAGTDWPGFFATLSDVFGPELVLVPDSGMHQMITRAFARIQWAGGILSPIDFQSMGFGLPAAIGALSANRQRPVASIIGDGGLVMTAPELLTAVREKLPLVVIVFNDGQYNLIRLQQLSAFGKAHGADVTPMDYGALCRSMGVRYYRLNRDVSTVISEIANDEGVRLLEIPLTDSNGVRSSAIKGQLKATARRHLSEGQLSWFQQLLRRRGSD